MELLVRENRKNVYIIYHGSRQLSTRTSDLDVAEGVFRRYQDSTVSNRPIIILDDPYISDIMDHFSGPTCKKRAATTTKLYHRIDKNIRTFWVVMRLSEVNVKACDEYIAWRKKEYTGRRPPIDSTIGIELSRLSSILNLFCEKRHLGWRPRMKIPLSQESSQLYFSPRDIIRLIRALHKWKEALRRQVNVSPRNRKQIDRIEATIRFIAIGAYTGTRKNAIRQASWKASRSNSFIDVEKGRFYRRGTGEIDTTKRRPAARLCDHLLRLARGWAARDQKRGFTTVIHGPSGAPLGDNILEYYLEKASRRAGLGRKVTPHALRHSCATWLLRAGVPLEKVAGFLGLTVAELEATYAEVHASFAREAAESLSRWGRG